LPIAVKLDDLLHDRRMTLTEFADEIGMALANLSILKTGKSGAIWEVLSCQPGDILGFEPKQPEHEGLAAAGARSTSR
jgi:putative transcriptional regulator